MKRLGILVFYDSGGIADEYVIELMKSLREVVGNLIIVVNGEILPSSEKKIRIWADQLFRRENLGYDAGAYKDVFTRFLTKEQIYRWDEIVLCNDTFFGPFYPWTDVFKEFENLNTDFWGLTRWIGGEACNQYFAEHIQSYFITIRKQMFKSPAFIQFWREMNFPLSLVEAIRNFEVAFTDYFVRAGFRYKAWIDIKGGAEYLQKGKSIYLSNPADLICNNNFPILKRRCFQSECFEMEEGIRIKEYVTKEYNYNWDFVTQNISRIYHNTLFSYDKIEEFYHAHQKIYVYGHGKYAKSVEALFHYKKWKIEKFIVTEIQEEKEDVISYESIRLEAEDGLILALGRKNLAEVYPKVHQDYDESQILMPYFKQYDDTQK